MTETQDTPHPDATAGNGPPETGLLGNISSKISDRVRTGLENRQNQAQMFEQQAALVWENIKTGEDLVGSTFYESFKDSIDKESSTLGGVSRTLHTARELTRDISEDP